MSSLEASRNSSVKKISKFEKESIKRGLNTKYKMETEKLLWGDSTRTN